MQSTEIRRRLLAKAGVLGVTLSTLLMTFGAAAHATPKVIVYVCGASSLRDVFASNRPTLQAIVRDGGTAVLTTGPDDTVFISSVLAGEYTRDWETHTPQRARVMDNAAIVVDAYYGGPIECDRYLARIEKQYPGALVIALGGVPEPLETDEHVRNRRPTWIAVSNLQGRLTSDTTRTPGIVSNLDVAPTVIAMVTGQTPADTVGRVIQSGGREGFQHSVAKPVAATIRLQDALGVLAQATDATNYSIAFGTILFIITGTALCGLRGKTKAKRFVQRALLVAAAAPIAVAVSAWRQPETPSVFYALSIAVTLALITAFILLGRAISASREDVTLAILEVALGALCAFVIADVARHGLPLKLSPLSNFYQTGIRFYGLGNEYAAIFIAAEILVALVALQRSGVAAPALGALTGLGAWYTGCAMFIGWPSLGANMGGMIAAFATGGLAWTLVARGRLRAAWLWPVIAAVLCVGMVVWTDVHTAHPTHIGAFVSGAARHSGGGILLTKLAINTRLLVQPVAWAIYVLALVTGWVWLRPLRPVLNRVRSTYPWLAPGFIATAFGGIVAMLVNDTGIVMLGLMAGVSAVAGMMLALEPPVGLTVLSAENSRVFDAGTSETGTSAGASGVGATNGKGEASR